MRIVSDETRKKMAESHRGKKHSAETLEKMSACKRGKAPQCAGWNKGLVVPDSVREKQSVMAKAKGFGKWMTGRKLSPGSIEKRQRSLKERVGSQTGFAISPYKEERHWNWKGGIHNAEGKAHHLQLRKARKKGADGAHTLAQWKELKALYGSTCPCCKRSEPEIRLTRDHIIPLTKGGSNNIDNIQPLCVSCNCRKYTRVIQYLRVA